MLDVFLAHAAQWVGSDPLLAVLSAFAWGLTSVIFSPCHLAAMPVMAAHAAGYTRAGHVRDRDVGAEVRLEDPAPPGLETSLSFAGGYFLAIAALGVACGLLGRMVEAWGEELWTIPAGLLLLWLGAALWREHDCSGTSRFLHGLGRRLGLGPRGGSAALGVGYGLLSSGCTLAFLSPVVVLSLPEGVWTVSLMAVGFALGHCLPMALVGFMTSLGRRLMRVCLLSASACASEESHAHSHARHALPERVFRKMIAATIVAGGVTLLLHHLWE